MMPRAHYTALVRKAGLLLLCLYMFVPVTRAELPAQWWQDRVFYEVFIRSFQDSDGDGIGDIQGLHSRLDYLNDGDPSTSDDLGITGIWLMPPAEAHSYHGYDVTDYRAVESDFGTLEQMRDFVVAARERGIAIIVDLPLNHTSNHHPWFVASQAGDPYYADWYIWSDEDPGYPGPWGAPTWHAAGGRFYYGVFWDGMPDLNFRNPAVSAEINDIAAFWLRDVGVDGFRLDAVKHIIEDGQRQENTPESRDWLSAFEATLEREKPNNFTVGEIYNGPPFIVARYLEQGAFDAAFDFNLADAMISAAQRGRNREIRRAHQVALREYPQAGLATFLSNHDQTRLVNRLLHDSERNKVAASLLLTGPGIPFLYYGEEIGIAGEKPDENLRSPMHWDDSDGAGFTSAAAPWQPLQAPDNVADANVARQSADAASLLSHYRRLIHLRNANSALRRGDFTPLDSSHSSLYSYLRHDEEQTLLVLLNLSEQPISDYALALEQSELDLSPPSWLWGEGSVAAPLPNDDGGFADYQPVASLPPYSLHILQF